VKEYLRMGDAFELPVDPETIEVYCMESRASTYQEGEGYAAHAINSHDELIRQRDDLLYALKQLLFRAYSFSVSGVYFNEFAENVAVIDLAFDAIELAGDNP
jgi:hypothetical protein